MPDLTFPVAYADRPNDVHWRRDTVTWSAICEWVTHPARRKECGNYILATLDTTEKVHAGVEEPCRAVHRDNRSVTRRSAVLALDIDAPEEGFDVGVEVVLDDYTYALHTTHSSTPVEPRYRLLIPVDRDMAPDEYIAATTAMAARLGKDNFDAGSFQPARFMFKPAARKPEWYYHQINAGDLVSVDDLLVEYDRDLAAIPMPTASRNKRDPFTIAGPMGDFNRAYDNLDELIEKFDLPYDRVSDDRYTLRGSTAEAGMGPIAGAPGLYYSHHANDPAYGKTCSAFDLVRLHLFLEEDDTAKPGTPVNKLPSHMAMLDLVSSDPRSVQESFNVLTEGLGPLEDEDTDSTTTLDWRSRLQRTQQGRFRDNVHNWDLIKRHDEVFALLRFNLMSMSPEANDDLPWRAVTSLTRTFDGVDHAELRDYIERNYTFRPTKEQVDHLVVTKAGQHRVSPVLDYLESLTWDGTPRVETCLPGAAPSRYNRLVARKVLTAAVARVYEPGLKWDHTLVLQGGEGLGKSTWIERMASVGIPERRPYHYTLGPLQSKDTLLAAHMSWIVFSDEGHSLRKADNDVLKEFLTRNYDVFRMPYDRDTVVHPRQFVIWSATNDETFLRRQEGNRRFLMVRCLERFDIDGMTPAYVDQLWAEAREMYKAGERLYLDDDESLLAAVERDPFLEEDSQAGIMQEFLERKVPLDWWQKTPDGRTEWIVNRAHGFEPEGIEPVDRTCSRQLWHEALGQKLPPRRSDLIEIGASLKAIGWVSAGPGYIPGYGNQTVYVRKDDML